MPDVYQYSKGDEDVLLPVALRASADYTLLGGIDNAEITIKWRQQNDSSWTTVGTVNAGTLGTFGGTATEASWIESALTGEYELGVPNNVFASGAGVNYAQIQLSASGAIVKDIIIQLLEPATLGSDNKVLVSDDQLSAAGNFPAALNEVGADATMGTAAKTLADYIARRPTASSATASPSGIDTLTHRSPIGAYRRLHNKVFRTGTSGGSQTITITSEDDSTGFFSFDVTSDAAAEPIMSADPST